MNIRDIPNKRTSDGYELHMLLDIDTGDTIIKVPALDLEFRLTQEQMEESNPEVLVDWLDTQIDNAMMDKLKERLAGEDDLEGKAVGGTDKKDLFWHAANQRSRLDPDGYEMRTINDTGKAL